MLLEKNHHDYVVFIVSANRLFFSYFIYYLFNLDEVLVVYTMCNHLFFSYYSIKLK